MSKSIHLAIGYLNTIGEHVFDLAFAKCSDLCGDPPTWAKCMTLRHGHKPASDLVPRYMELISDKIAKKGEFCMARVDAANMR